MKNDQCDGCGGPNPSARLVERLDEVDVEFHLCNICLWTVLDRR